MNREGINPAASASSGMGAAARLAATAISIALYLLLWMLCVFVFYVFTRWAGFLGVLIGVLFMGSRWIKRRWLSSLSRDLILPLLAGFLIGLAQMKVLAPISIAVVGGIVNGVIRRQFLFGKIFENRIVKVVVLFLVPTSLTVFLATCVFLLSPMNDVPAQLVTLSKTPPGWTAQRSFDLQSLYETRVKYTKGNSILTIGATNFPVPPPAIDWYQKRADMTAKGVAISFRGRGAGQVDSKFLGRSESTVLRGGPRFRYHYRIEWTRGTSSFQTDVLAYYFHCPTSGTAVNAVAIIGGDLVELLTREVEEMVSTQECL